MSTISNITTTVVSAFQGVTPVTEAAPVDAPANTAPAFQETLTTQGRAFALGLGAPRNHGDIEAIFAEIATKFGAEVSKANDFANAAQTAVRSTALSAAAGFLAFYATFNTIMVSAELNISAQNQTIGEKTVQINELEAQKAPLVAQRDALVNEYNANANQYWTNINTINSLNGQLATLVPQQTTACAANGNAATCQSLTTQVNNIRAQITGLESWNTGLVNRNNEIVPQINSLNSQIAVLQGQIDVAIGERNAAISSRNQSQNAYNTALATITVFAAVAIPFTVALALGQVGDGARASFELGPNQKAFDDAIAQAVNRLAELSEEMGTLSLIRQALAQIMPSAPDTIVQPTKVEARNTVPDVQPDTVPDEQSNLGVPETPLLPVVELGQTEEPTPDIIPGTQPLPPPVPQTPVVGGTPPGGQLGVVETAQALSGMEMLKQILANLPKPTEQFLPDPDPVVQTETPPLDPGIPERPQTAFDAVRQLLQDILPPAVGNAEEVASRAGDIATALVLLRAALAQLAQGDTAQTPQMPGPSGRLNLVI